ncbi:acyltransferase [Ancylobacter sp. A5.8]|uniref:acyltransferase family protein n=1 Tax=Ancylobacter gelatini TaxID=2919920 RepID=UPI001F4D788C|nr:acyltransferase [Ancylobacter gelatini]MCJ8143878.1 acyltransferase [Ancylobacter gelatini]
MQGGPTTPAGSAVPVPDALAVTRLPHLPDLDGIRAVAVGIVVLAHLGLDRIVPGGFGVTIFFFLSGYLITSLMRIEMHNTGRISYAGFYTRRVLRIIPPFWITGAFSLACIGVGLIGRPIDWQGVAADVLFLTNYTDVYTSLDGFPGLPLWSLAVEEHFYLFFPLVIGLFLPRFGARRLALWCAIACALVLLVRLANVYGFGIVGPNDKMTHTRIDSILFGCVLALWQNPVLEGRAAWRPNRAHVGLALVALLAMFAIRNEEFRQTVRYSVQGAALFVLFAYVLQNRIPVVTRLLRSKVAQTIGLYSFTIYLVHFVFIGIAESRFPEAHGVLRAAFVILGTWAYSALMYRLVERPLAQLRQRMNRRNEKPLLSPAA